MRKADYAHLAAVLARTIVDARVARRLATDIPTNDVALARETAARDIAFDFVRDAAVDRAAFLKACGIE